MVSQLTSATKPLLLTLDMAESECEKMRCLEARFGQSVTNAGDLNLDNYPGMSPYLYCTPTINGDLGRGPQSTRTYLYCAPIIIDD